MAINARMARAASEAVGEARRMGSTPAATPPAGDGRAFKTRVPRPRHRGDRRAGSPHRAQTANAWPGASLRDHAPCLPPRPPTPPLSCRVVSASRSRFGYKAQVVDQRRHRARHAGLHRQSTGRSMLVPAIQRISQLVDDVPRSGDTDRGYARLPSATRVSTRRAARSCSPTKAKPTPAVERVETRRRSRSVR